MVRPTPSKKKLSPPPPAVAGSTPTEKPSTFGRRVEGQLQSILQGRPVTPSLVEALVGEAPSDTGNIPAFLEFFASALHAVYVVTLTENAQRGLHFTGDGHRSSPSMMSSYVTPRWCGGVAQLLKHSITLDDLSRLSHFFPQWLSIRWYAPSSLWKPSQLSDIIRRENNVVAVPHTRSGSSGPYGKLQARLFLSAGRVISVAEAKQFLSESICQWRECTDAKRLMEHPAMRCTAYQSFRAQQLQEGSAAVPRQGSETATEGTTAAPPPSSSVTGVNWSDEEKERLLGMISPELRSSLSTEKLNGLLVQLQKEANQVEWKQYQRIEAQRIAERLLRTYQQIRSLYGARRNVMSLSALLHHLREEGGRFQEGGALVPVMAELVSIPSSGLSLTKLEPGEVTNSGLTDLLRMPEEDYEWVVVSLDKEKASLQGVAQAVEQKLKCSEACPNEGSSALASST